MGDIRWTDGEIEIPGVISKGKKSRTVTMCEEVARALDRYIGESREGPEQNGAPIFLTPQGEAITAAGLTALFRRLSRTTGVAFSAHVLRHTWATNYMRSGSGSILDLQREGGWKDLRMVRRYAHIRPLAERQRAPSPFTILDEQNSSSANRNRAYVPRFTRKSA